MCFFCGLGFSNLINSLGLCGFAENFPVLGMAPKTDEVLQFLKLDREALNLVQSCQRMY